MKPAVYVYLITREKGKRVLSNPLPTPLAERKYLGKEYTWIIMKDREIVSTFSGFFIKKCADEKEARALMEELNGTGRYKSVLEKVSHMLKPEEFTELLRDAALVTDPLSQELIKKLAE